MRIQQNIDYLSELSHLPIPWNEHPYCHAFTCPSSTTADLLEEKLAISSMGFSDKDYNINSLARTTIPPEVI